MPKVNYLDEYVMVIPTEALWEAGHFQGLTFATEKYFRLIEDSRITRFLRRKDIENDQNYKQIIPYVIFMHQETIFSYRRGKLLKEKRLLGAYSIGIGGHISVFDTNLFTETYKQGMAREIYEEIRVDANYDQHLAAMINDDTNDVGRVHFGVVHLFELEQPHVHPKEKSINEAMFIPLPKLENEIEKYENWSQICIRNIKNLIGCQY
jgi:predicted NUDIX family phosphoesterase